MFNVDEFVADMDAYWNKQVVPKITGLLAPDAMKIARETIQEWMDTDGRPLKSEVICDNRNNTPWDQSHGALAVTVLFTGDSPGVNYFQHQLRLLAACPL